MSVEEASELMLSTRMSVASKMTQRTRTQMEVAHLWSNGLRSMEKAPVRFDIWSAYAPSDEQAKEGGIQVFEG